MLDKHIEAVESEKETVKAAVCDLLDDFYSSGIRSETIRLALKELHEGSGDRFTYDE
jgi:uncharacterized protein (UPF0335 family)